MNNMPPVTKNLLIINGLMALATYVLKVRFGIVLDEWLGLHFFMATHFRIYQFITYMFMHASLDVNPVHLLFNMFALWMFGRIIEQVFGAKRFLLFYIVCGIGAGFIQELAQFAHYYVAGLNVYTEVNLSGAIMSMGDFLDNWNTVGASGAIYGILLAFGMTFPDERMFIFPIPIPIKAKFFVIGYAAIELFFAVIGSNDNVAHMAHLGGMLFGLILILRWRNPNKSFLSGLSKQFSNWKKPKMKVTKGGGKFSDEMDYNARRKAQDEEIDRILDKVKKHGYGCLTEEEKRKLFNASGRK